MIRERRRYQAVMPEEAFPRGRPPRSRARKRDAWADVADGIERYLEHDQRIRGRVAQDVGAWSAWALRLGTQGFTRDAPDGSKWGVITKVDYV